MADAPAELASGKLLLDEPAPGAVRLAIHNPSAAARSTTSSSTRWPRPWPASTRAAW